MRGRPQVSLLNIDAFIILLQHVVNTHTPSRRLPGCAELVGWSLQKSRAVRVTSARCWQHMVGAKADGLSSAVPSGPKAYQSLSTHCVAAGLCLGTALGAGAGGQGWLCSWLSSSAPLLFLSSTCGGELALVGTPCSVVLWLGDAGSLELHLLAVGTEPFRSIMFCSAPFPCVQPTGYLENKAFVSDRSKPLCLPTSASVWRLPEDLV